MNTDTYKQNTSYELICVDFLQDKLPNEFIGIPFHMHYYCSAIYKVFDGRTLVYIGSTSNLYLRTNDPRHAIISTIPESRLRIEAKSASGDKQLRVAEERTLIEQFQPQLNKTYTNKKAKKNMTNHYSSMSFREQENPRLINLDQLDDQYNDTCEWADWMGGTDYSRKTVFKQASHRYITRTAQSGKLCSCCYAHIRAGSTIYRLRINACGKYFCSEQCSEKSVSKQDKPSLCWQAKAIALAPILYKQKLTQFLRTLNQP